MRPMRKIVWALFLAMPFLILNAVNISAEDYVPEVTARVARISFISGNVQIKRADSRDWERATNNLPVVEGDEIVTDENARLEIQFNSETFLRLSENTYLKITTLRDEGIAVSLPNGTMSARLLNFRKERGYFEIDAPQTTVSVEKSGMYRVDAGSRNDREVRVSVTDSGQARVYSENSGLTLKNGRRATIQIDGDYAGEWETSEAARYADDFDSWTLQRDAVIAKRLRDAYYDKYYDRDIYGAEDLNEYGEWIYTRKYGYVWKPFRTSVSSYANWSPYRYGQWRWIPPYGWTWVNDEPWGWATYHHGRWVWDNGNWYWTPYAQSRWRRSWWRPALVVVTYSGNLICWYPLPYNYGYYNYNSYYVDRRRYNTTIINNTTVIVNPAPTPAPVVTTGVLQTPGKINPRLLSPPADSIPEMGVVAVDASSFGTGKTNFRTAPLNLAKKVLSETPSEAMKPPVLPTFKELNGNVSKEILAPTPRTVRAEAQIKTGAIERTDGIAIGENLRRERILGNRAPVEKVLPAENNGGLESAPPIRNTGAVKRQPRGESFPPSDGVAPPVRQPSENDGLRNTNRVRPNRDNNDGTPENQPVKVPRIRGNDQESAPPVYNPPREERRVEAPTRVEPRREEPRPQPAPRQEAPPEKPAAPNNDSVVNQKEKDGR